MGGVSFYPGGSIRQFSFLEFGMVMTGLQIIVMCGIVAVVVSIASILVSTSYGCDWLLQIWRKIFPG